MGDGEKQHATPTRDNDDSQRSSANRKLLTLPVLPLRTDVPFPQIILPLVIGREKGIRLIDSVHQSGNKEVALAIQNIPDLDDPDVKDLYPVVCIASILKMLKFPDGSTRIVAHGSARARIVEVLETQPYLLAKLEVIEDKQTQPSIEHEALVLAARKQFSDLIDRGAQVTEDLHVAVMNTHEPGSLCDLLASGLPFSTDQKLELLGESRIKARLKKLLTFARHLVEMQDLSSRIQGEVTGELSRMQRDQFLRQQLQAIRRELGEMEDENSEITEFGQRINQARLPESVATEAKRELNRMSQMHPSTPEFHVIRTYLDTLLSMPWHHSTEDQLDVKKARSVLDSDHYNLQKVKERILEFLAVRKLRPKLRGPILCFLGPPGVGKTSLGKSIARTMGRKFMRISLGGVHDEAEIRGHRRTYIGAMPGRIVQAIRKLGVNNPVIMLDEIDKLGSDYRGDPAHALLEVLDPEQNNTFRDHYLDCEFDLSRVMFICTANNLSTIPLPLVDRMEIIEVSGYSDEEKLVIAKRYLLPKQVDENGLPSRQLPITDEALRCVIHSYTHEAGVRGLDREIASLCRKLARQLAEEGKKPKRVDVKHVVDLLGPAKYLRSERFVEPWPGLANGLAWTPVGGEVLSIESIKAPSKKSALKLTGSLGEVMKESAHAAFGYLKANRDRLKIEQSFFDDYEMHMHVPAGAIAKDGPSAGVAIAASMLSLATGQVIASDVAMTGEITLAGRVLPVGGIREKVLAARREKIKTIIIPHLNQRDVEEIPIELRNELTFHFVKHMDQVIPVLFGKQPDGTPRRRKNAGKTAGRSTSASL